MHVRLFTNEVIILVMLGRLNCKSIIRYRVKRPTSRNYRIRMKGSVLNFSQFWISILRFSVKSQGCVVK
jgi:hypothetical protein